MAERRSYSSSKFKLEIPYLLEVQKNSFKSFLQTGASLKDRKKVGLERIFRDIFPITDVKELYSLEYEGYSFGIPKYSLRECRERGMTYSVPLRAVLSLYVYEGEGEEKKFKEKITNDVFICDLPQMTDNGTFVINGAERVVVSQLHRSPGVSFDEDYHTNGKKLWKSRIIPYRGSWVEFLIDADEALYINIDRRRKMPATILLRALGYSTNQQILELFYQSEVLKISQANLEDIEGKVIFKDIVDTETGEVIAEANGTLDSSLINKLLDAGIKEITVVSSNLDDDPVIHNTIASDNTTNEEEALFRIYTLIRPGDPPNIATARTLFEKLFFDDKRYDLGEVGRYRLNSRLNVNVPLDTMTMTKEDFMAIIKYMVALYNGVGDFDDIDHLGNRRARSVGELLGNQLAVGLTRLSRAIRERLSLRDNEEITPQDLINARTVSSVVATFFGSSQLSQFMDQTNPLAELTHKRRMSALGPGGLTRERAGFEVRDVHHTHYGRLCPIETPEGPNIGLINSLATYSIINHFGFLETPYRVVGDVEYTDQSGAKVLFPLGEWHYEIFKGFCKDPMYFVQQTLSDSDYAAVARTLDENQKDLFYSFVNKVFQVKTQDGPKLFKNGILIENASPKPDFVQVGEKKSGRVTSFIVYLTADQEDLHTLAPASTILDENDCFVDEYVIVRRQGEFPAYPKDQVELMDVSPRQIVSIAAGLIPFLEHDDANRALMGSNMQRQAVPLLRSEAPLVGTGMEERAALDSGTVVRAQFDGEIVAVDASRIIVKRDVSNLEDENFLGLPEYDTYILRKYERSNQDTCINEKPIVKVGDIIRSGDILADGASTDRGELAIGKNILVGFLPWNGYNFEDAIIISEELRIADTFTSIHIEEFDVEVRDTKRGPEELTREIPNVSEESLVNLDEQGIIRVGAEIEPGDIIVGKVTPKGETELSPEERLLRAIFGEKAGDVRDSSLKASPGLRGIVVETRIFARKERDSKAKASDKEKIAEIREEIGGKVQSIIRARNTKLNELMLNQVSGGILDGSTNEVLIPADKKITEVLLKKINFSDISSDSVYVKDQELNVRIEKILDIANTKIVEFENILDKEIDKVVRGDELKPGVLQLVKVYVAKKRRLSIGDKMAGRHGNKGVISKIVPVEDMPFTEDGRPLQILLNPLGVPSRMNVGQVLEVHLGWAAKALGIKVATPVFDGASFDQIQDALREANLPINGKTRLIDGRTGEAFMNDVTIGYMYMLKLGHLVDDKMHARSIGPYSLVTQQPLGGKSQFGGQRFGEMEVWALEAYGAAYTLQELLTVKSDDVMGRSKIYESIVKGENTPSPGIPESFNVLIKEIQALGLDIKIGAE
jgi:DNA-directed RNA polymerase subunit beta